MCRNLLKAAVIIIGCFLFRFHQNFRISKVVFVQIYEEIENMLPVPLRDTYVRPILRLALILRYIAHGDYQLSVSNQLVAPLSKATFSRILSEYLPIMEGVLCPKWIKLRLGPEEIQQSIDHFEQRFGMTGVIGCVDGTHINLISPGANYAEWLYVNRKNRHSLNVMIISDYKCRIRFINSAYEYFMQNERNLAGLYILGK